MTASGCRLTRPASYVIGSNPVSVRPQFCIPGQLSRSMVFRRSTAEHGSPRQKFRQALQPTSRCWCHTTPRIFSGVFGGRQFPALRLRHRRRRPDVLPRCRYSVALPRHLQRHPDGLDSCCSINPPPPQTAPPPSFPATRSEISSHPAAAPPVTCLWPHEQLGGKSCARDRVHLLAVSRAALLQAPLEAGDAVASSVCKIPVPRTPMLWP